ncbi:hypothetical protein C1H46_012699 [Malus baccata]|uniref:Uncharacterized protein n=1 Tax=Malus baccata TaxID=106549 RepID=A0A540MSI2_MALBA|nr:hypothetical protein C1H46_012699 [Malus baccata]
MAFHTRSNSFPSRRHPIIQEIDEHLCRLRSSKDTSTSSSSISHKLSGLQDLHDCVEKWLSQKYLSSRKMVKKAIQKAMKNLKCSSLNKDNETVAIGPKSQPRSWSLVSKMMQSRKVACKEETEANEFTIVDATLHRSADNAQSQLEKLESCIQDQEEGLECLFRQLIKTRVSLLNILNH